MLPAVESPTNSLGLKFLYKPPESYDLRTEEFIEWMILENSLLCILRSYASENYLFPTVEILFVDSTEFCIDVLSSSIGVTLYFLLAKFIKSKLVISFLVIILYIEGEGDITILAVELLWESWGTLSKVNCYYF